jgi:NADPH:quinone reductase-like Zn-dependent oxidoreductase
MMAAATDRFGGPSLLKPHIVPVPEPGPSEILIALHTAGVGIWDAEIRKGNWRPPGRSKFPLIPGVDGAGRVAAVGSRVTRFRAGDRVYAYEFGNPHGGFYAEYVAVHQGRAGHVPDGLDLRSAGAAAVTALTALQGVRALALGRGETVLVFGASGAVGTLAVQFARSRGARVIGTATGAAAQRLVRSLGAADVFDTRSKHAIVRLRALAPQGVDAVLALAGGEQLEQCLESLRPNGRVVYPNGVEPAPRRRKGRRVAAYDAIASPKAFAELARAIKAARLRVPIAARYPLTRAAAAHKRLEAGRVIGRVVLSI